MPSSGRFLLIGSFSPLSFLPLFITPEPGRRHHARGTLPAAERENGGWARDGPAHFLFSPPCLRSLGPSCGQGVASWRRWHEVRPLSGLPSPLRLGQNPTMGTRVPCQPLLGGGLWPHRGAGGARGAVWSQEWQGPRPMQSGGLNELLLEVGSLLSVRTRTLQAAMLVGGCLCNTWTDYK